MRVAGTFDGTAHPHVSQSGERTPHARLERQRGLKSFLTWAFFLAGASAAEALLTGGARTQDEDDWVNSAKRPDERSDELPNETIQQRMEVAEAAAGASSSSSSPGASALTTPDQAQSPAVPIGPPAPAGGTIGSGAAAAAAQGRVGSSGNPDSAVPDMLPDLHFGVQMAPQPLHADVSLALLGFELNGDGGGLISAGLGLDLDNLIPDPLQGVTNLLDSLTSDLGNLLDGDGLLGGILETAPLSLGELTGLTLTNGIAGLLGQRDENAPASSQSESGPGETAAFVTDAGEFSAPALLSGGTINFPAGTTNAPPPDELFAQGRHTHYNIALGDESERDASPVQTDTSDLPEGTTSQDSQPPADSSIADTSVIDDLVARPTL